MLVTQKLLSPVPEMRICKVHPRQPSIQAEGKVLFLRLRWMAAATVGGG
jgi:hypothetical protein